MDSALIYLLVQWFKNYGSVVQEKLLMIFTILSILRSHKNSYWSQVMERNFQ